MITWMNEAHAAFNKVLFDGKLPDANFSYNMNRKAIMEFMPTASFQIGSGVTTASDAAVLDELVHVMIHSSNHEKGLQDHTANQYHNNEFKLEALRVGLHVASHKSRGWALTLSRKSHAAMCSETIAPVPKASALLRSTMFGLKNCKQALDAIRAEATLIIANKPQKQYLLKYVCKCEPPNNSIRSGRRPDGDHPIDITCNICRSKFEFETETT